MKIRNSAIRDRKWYENVIWLKWSSEKKGLCKYSRIQSHWDLFILNILSYCEKIPLILKKVYLRPKNLYCYIECIGCFLKRFSINKTKKCKKKWIWPRRRMKIWYKYNYNVVLIFASKLFLNHDFFGWSGLLEV